MPRPRRLLPLAVAAGTAAALLACGGAAQEPPGTAAAPTPPSAPTGGAAPLSPAAPTGPPARPTATATFPDDPVGGRLAWMVGQMGTDPVTDDPGAHFDPAFLAQLPEPQVIVMFGELRRQGPWTLERVDTSDREGVATLVSGPGVRYTLSMTLAESGLIAGALLRTTAKGEPASDWAGVDARAALAAPDTAILAARVGAQGELHPVHRSGGDQPRPAASAVRLYVLAAVAEAVAAGRLGWDTELTLTSADTSLPGGTSQQRPEGTKVAVREAAQQMIAAADNSATDLLIRTLGEPAVLAAARAAGHRHPAGITPFLTTRQLFWLGWGDSPQAEQARRQWSQASESRRRALLAAVPMPGPGPRIDASSAPVWDSGLDRFATPTELARAHLRLQDLAATRSGAPVRDLLARNGGIKVDGWDYTAFTGGGNVGVLAMSFYAEKGTGADRRREVLVLMGRGSGALDEATFVAAAQDGARLLAAAR